MQQKNFHPVRTIGAQALGPALGPITIENIGFLWWSMAIAISGSILFCVVLLLTAPDHLLRAVGAILTIATSISAAIALHKGLLPHTIAILIYGSWCTLVATAIISGGLRSPGAIAYPLLLCMAGWLLGRRHLITLAALTVATLAVLAIGEERGIFPLVILPPTPPAILLIILIIIIFITAIFINYILGCYESRFQRIVQLDEDLAERINTLAAREAQLRLITDNMPAMVVHYDRELICRFANPSYVELFGFTQSSIVGRHLREIVGEETFGGLGDYIQRVLFGESLSYENICYVGEKREPHHLEITLTPDKDSTGEINGIYVMILDVTERRHAEENLRRSEDNFSLAFRNSPIPILISRLKDGLYIDVNNAICQRYGWSRTEIVGHTANELNVWASATDRDKWAHSLQATGRVSAFETTMLTKSGERLHVLISSEKMLVEGEECALSLLFDLTERKKMEESLRQSEARARVLAEGSSTGIFLCAPDGETVYTNPSINQIIGCTNQETLGYRWTEFIHPDDRDRVHSAWLASIEKRIGYELDYRFLRKDGAVRFVHVRAMAVHENGQLLCYVGNVADVTEGKRAEQEILRLNTELESRVKNRTAELVAANKELESFAYSISHDLRAPLRGIDGFSQMLVDEYSDKLDEKGHDYLNRVRRAAQRMGTLIDDILDLSRVTRQGMRRESINLSQLTKELFDDLEKTYPNRNIALHVAPHCVVVGDPQLLRVLMQNLLDNALKYTGKTPDALIEFGYEKIRGQTTYFVKDNGAGFDMQYAGRLFQPFQRLHSPEDFEGSGVGLATVARVVHRHGGSVWAEASKGDGATFHFTLGAGEHVSQ